METLDWRPEPKNSDTLLAEAPGMVKALSGVLMSAANARERYTLSAARKPPGVMVIPLKCSAAGDSVMLFWVSWILTTVLAMLVFRSVTSPFSSVTVCCC